MCRKAVFPRAQHQSSTLAFGTWVPVGQGGVISSSTRLQLAAALRERLSKTQLNKVTVSSLAADVGITRQAFYYHFADTYALAVWTFEHEVANHIMDHASYKHWADGYRTLLLYLDRNFDQTCAVLNCLNHKERDVFFLDLFREMMEAVVSELEGDLDVPSDDRTFVIDHYASIVLGHFLRWIAEPVRENPNDLVPRIERILKGTVRKALEEFAGQKEA